MALPSIYGNLNESELLGLIVNHSYEGFIPVRNATAGLDAYEPMSIIKTRIMETELKRKDQDNQGFGAALKKFVSPTTAKKEHQGRPALEQQLYPAEVFDDPTGIPNESVEPKKIGQRRSVYKLNNSSEWNTELRSSSPSPDPKSSKKDDAPRFSSKWKADNEAPSINLGSVYEKKVKRSEITRWLAEHEGQINQKELKHLTKTSNLFIIDHVLYSEKIVIEYGSSSGEKSLVAGQVSASATFETTCSSGEAIIRATDVGKKPIAFRVARLLTKKSKKTPGKRRNRPLRLTLAPQESTALELKNLSSPYSNDSSKESSSGKSFFSFTLTSTDCISGFLKVVNAVFVRQRLLIVDRHM